MLVERRRRRARNEDRDWVSAGVVNQECEMRCCSWVEDEVDADMLGEVWSAHTSWRKKITSRKGLKESCRSLLAYIRRT